MRTYFRVQIFIERRNQREILKNRTEQNRIFTKNRDAQFDSALDDLAQRIRDQKELEAVGRAKEKLIHAGMCLDYINVVALAEHDGKQLDYSSHYNTGLLSG